MRDGMMRRAMDPIEIAWAAGFYEGEGHFGVRHNPYGHPTALRMSVAQRTEEPLLRFYAAVSIGKMVFRPLVHGKPLWNWQAGKTGEAVKAVSLLWPHLSERRRDQVEIAVDEFLSVPHRLHYDLAFMDGDLITWGGEYHG